MKVKDLHQVSHNEVETYTTLGVGLPALFYQRAE
jgi:hypothetical protein